ncbi:MAG: hypothetical protein II410_02545 [Ruminococcus sp.]|nr:hypothetical protein [Ruminococcus sp.]
MPIVIILAVLIAAGVANVVGQDKRKSYDSDTTRQMLKDMTGKSKRECKKIIKKYRRR